MQPKLLKLFQSEQALYRIEEWDGENTSGLSPRNNLILVRTDECNDRGPGGVFYPDDVRERMTMASETGVIVAVSSQAFKFTLDGRRWPDDDPEKPKVGDRIRFSRYSGSLFLGYDKRTYRAMNDSAVMGVFDVERAPFLELPPIGEGFSFPSLADAIAGLPQGESEAIPPPREIGFGTEGLAHAAGFHESSEIARGIVGETGGFHGFNLDTE